MKKGAEAPLILEPVPVSADRADAQLDALGVGERQTAAAALARLDAVNLGGLTRIGGDQHHLGNLLLRGLARRQILVVHDLAQVLVGLDRLDVDRTGKPPPRVVPPPGGSLA